MTVRRDFEEAQMKLIEFIDVPFWKRMGKVARVLVAVSLVLAAIMRIASWIIR